MATILDGKAFASEIYADIKQQVGEIEQNGDSLTLAIISVGEDVAWQQYAGSIVRNCDKVGIDVVRCDFLSNVTNAQLLDCIHKLNADPTITGIFLQYPLPKNLNGFELDDAISPNKDVDGQSKDNIAHLMRNRVGLTPATPQGVIDLLDRYEISVSGKKCVVVGRSLTVGRPLATMLTHLNGTVTICHSKTVNLVEECANADILLVAIGKARFINGGMVKEGAVVVDIGTNFIDGKLVGDVDFDTVVDKVSYINRASYGVATVTTATLLNNLIKAYYLQQDNLSV